MIGKSALVGLLFLATLRGQGGSAPTAPRGQEDLESLFRELLVLPRLDLRWGLGVGDFGGWQLSVSSPPDFHFVFPPPQRISEEQLAIADRAVATAPMSARAHLEYAELLRRARTRRDASVRATPAALAALQQEHLAFAERLLRDRVGGQANEDDVLVYAQTLRRLGRSLEAQRLLVELANADRRSWRACLMLAELSGAEWSHQLVRQPMVAVVGGLLSPGRGQSDEYLRRAIEFSAGDENVRARVNDARLQLGLVRISEASAAGDLRAITVALEGLREIYAEGERVEGDSPIVVSVARRHLLLRLLLAMLDGATRAQGLIEAPQSTDEVETALRWVFGAPSADDLAYYARVDQALLALDAERGFVGEGELIRVFTALLRCDAGLATERLGFLSKTSADFEELVRFLESALAHKFPLGSMLLGNARHSSPSHGVFELLNKAHEWYGEGDFSLARASFETVVARYPDSQHGRLGVALTMLLDPACQDMLGRVRRLLLAIAEPGDEDRSPASFRALAHAGVALLAVRSEDLQTAVQRMRVATRTNPTKELLRLRAAVERAAAERLPAASPERAALALAALQSLAHALEASGQQGEPGSQEELKGLGDRLRAWVAVGLDWLAEAGSGISPEVRLRLEARLLRAGLAVGGGDKTVAALRARLLDNLARRHANGELGDGEKFALARIAFSAAASAGDASRRVEMLQKAIQVATELTAASGGCDPQAALLLAQALASSGRDQEAVALLEEMIASVKSRLDGSRFSRLADLELALAGLRLQRISDPVVSRKLREWCEPLVGSPARPLESLLILARLQVDAGSPSGFAEARELLARAVGEEEREPVLWLMRSHVAAAEDRSADARSHLVSALAMLREHGWGRAGWLAHALLRDLASPSRQGGWNALLEGMVGQDGIRSLTGR